MAFQEEQLVALIRRSWVTLVLPLLTLFVSAALVSYINNRVVEPWLGNLILVLAAIGAAVWLISIVRHLIFYIKLTTSRLIVRDGIFGQKSIELSLAEVTAVEVGKGRTLRISRRDAEPLVLAKTPRAKMLAAEIRSLARL